MNENEITDLLVRYTKGECTPEESAFVISWYIQLMQQSSVEFTLEELVQADANTRSKLPAPVQRRLISAYIKYTAAAAIALITFTWIFYFNSNRDQNLFTKTNTHKPIQPGGNNAILTLANGKQINLKDIRNGAMAIATGTVVTNDTSNGVVTFESSSGKTELENNQAQTDQKNLNITTPRGGEYTLVLPDGSSVHLNASSSLQFPARFTDNQRTVTLTGEAYFEIAKNPKRPFTVISNGQHLTVLGTHFAISAYPNETIKTTLSEGSVQLTNSSSLKNQILQPEQQAVLTATGFKIKQVNSADEMAWKDGLFLFTGTPIADVLRQLSRWYNVEVDYDSLPDGIILDADLSRTTTLQDIISAINFTNANKGFKIHLNAERKLEVIRK